MNAVSTRVRSISGRSALVVSMLVLLGISSAAQAVDNVQSSYAGAEAGDWGGSNGAVIGPPDGTCANMGAVGKVNLVSGFDFNLPSNATVTGITAFAKAGENGPQSVDVQIATNATVDPPTTVGNALQLSVPGTGGACSDTTEIEIGTTLASWGIGALTYLQVNSPNFGMVFTKTATSSIKVDSVCMNIAYTTPEGSAVVEDCFEVVTPEANGLTVVKAVVGAAPGSDWDFNPDWDDPFTLAAGGGFQEFGDLTDGLYTVSETTKEGYVASVQCFEGETVVASGTDSVVVDLDNADLREDFAVTCIFTNTEIVPPPPASRTTFTVQKNFSDGNTDQDVTINIQCFTGLPLNQSQTVNPDNGGEFEVEFVVESFEQGTLDCDVWEDEVPGYTGSYSAESTVSPDYGSTAEGCFYNDIDSSNARAKQNLCEITNDPDPVEVTVIKDWEVDGSGGDALDPRYRLVLWCDGEIEGGTDCNPKNESCPGDWYIVLTQNGTGDTEDTPYTADVIPDWDGGTQCWVQETVWDSSVEVDDSDCNNSGDLDVELGGTGDYECTIVNTVFYEGIPTLSQYGMAIMALLMLGVGFVGFRRFV